MLIFEILIKREKKKQKNDEYFLNKYKESKKIEENEKCKKDEFKKRLETIKVFRKVFWNLFN